MPMSSVVHFEIPADDVARAQTFYTEAFGFEIQTVPGFEYAFVTTTPISEDGRPTEPGAINGGMFTRSEQLTGPIVTISVDDIDAALAKVEASGGKTLIGRQAVGDMGFSAYFVDSEGNTMGMWQNAM
jgi:predicted enzyme related to lactoylglutathione lyase